ncbi:hypothetical protein Ancab_000311 [Ancistrocladus abbreviatus]
MVENAEATIDDENGKQFEEISQNNYLVLRLGALGARAISASIRVTGILNVYLGGKGNFTSIRVTEILNVYL